MSVQKSAMSIAPLGGGVGGGGGGGVGGGGGGGQSCGGSLGYKCMYYQYICACVPCPMTHVSPY